ncbi:hypothetical protein H5410_007453 [Solanum commersonii]|uniref:CCHC-type domain-containing protein n=1 Tax=Solanum commersonii TaxID=4109 RepID=A0A9J6AD36_SOLCO|nr:hypothetical protein H5410_007453 [Solanum commersonii]
MEGGNDPMTMLAGRGHVSQGRKSGVICEHCGYKGHTKETCYRIIGFPTDFKSKRRVSTDEDNIPLAHVSTAEAGSSTLGGGTATASRSDSSHFHFPGGYFTKEHYDQVMKMMVSQPIGSTHDYNQPIMQPTSLILTSTPADALHETMVEPSEAEIMVEPVEADHTPVDNPVHPDDIQQENIGLRKTSRATKPLVWIKDYIVPQKSHPHTITNHSPLLGSALPPNVGPPDANPDLVGL